MRNSLKIMAMALTGGAGEGEILLRNNEGEVQVKDNFMFCKIGVRENADSMN